MFDIDKAESFVAAIAAARALPVTIGAFIFYPILMIVVFIAFSLLCLVFYRFTLYCYKVEDDQLQLRNAGLDLLERRLGRPTKFPREFRD
jgi:membrane protein YdbS with pleckstrin-like domain